MFYEIFLISYTGERIEEMLEIRRRFSFGRIMLAGQVDACFRKMKNELGT